MGDESIHWRLARGAIPEKKGGEKIGAYERKKSEKERVGIGKIPPQEVERRRRLEVGDRSDHWHPAITPRRDGRRPARLWRSGLFP